MIHDIIFIIFISLLSCSISHMLDYGLGHPYKDQYSTEGSNPTAFLFGWSTLLAFRKLQKIAPEQLALIISAFSQDRNSSVKRIRINGNEKYWLAILYDARDLFTWERALGMCIFCTNFWLSMAISIIAPLLYPLEVFPGDFLFLCIPAFSHAILRIISKINN